MSASRVGVLLIAGGFIAGSGDELLRRALLQLLEPAENRATRYEAAQQALALERAGDGARRILAELTGSR